MGRGGGNDGSFVIGGSGGNRWPAKPSTRPRRFPTGTVMYHACYGERVLKLILKEGLRPFSTGYGREELDQDWKQSVYFFEERADAENYPRQQFNSDWHVLAVDVSGLPLRPDPCQGTEKGRCWRVEEHVPADRVIDILSKRLSASERERLLHERLAA